VQARVARKKITLVLDEKAKDFLVQKGFQPEMGARPLRRVIEQYLEDPLAEKLLLNPGKGGSWSVSAEDSKLTFTEQEPPQEEAKNDMQVAEPPSSHP
jgi:ATP-dependent Clp protease ATP-binding subunit ClpC